MWRPAIEFVEHLAALHFRRPISGGLTQIFGMNRLRHQTEDEGHDRFASLGLFLAVPNFIFLGRFSWDVFGVGEAEFRHAQTIVPGAVAVIVVAAGLDQFLMQEAFAMLMHQRFREKPFVGGLAVLRMPIRRRLARVFVVVPLFHDVVMFLHIGGDVFKCKPFRIFFAPIVQRGAERLGPFEAGDVMAAETTQSADALLADVILQFVFIDRRSQQPFVGVYGHTLDPFGAEPLKRLIAFRLQGFFGFLPSDARPFDKGDAGQLLQIFQTQASARRARSANL